LRGEIRWRSDLRCTQFKNMGGKILADLETLR